MINFTSTKVKLKQFYQKKRPFLLSAFLCLLLYGFSFIPLMPPAPGINQPTAIGAYLNGAFPDASPSGTNENWTVENAYPNLDFEDPVAMIDVPFEDNYYIVGKTGLIWKIDKNNPLTTIQDTVLNIVDSVDTDIDSGVVNALLHPEFGQAGSPNRGYMYVFYRWHPNGNPNPSDVGCNTYSFLRLSRFTRPDGSDTFDRNSEFVLVQTFDEHCWHNGGGMFFDEDGYLYYTVGDAGEINDPWQTTQKLDDRLMSGLFRIDLEPSARNHPIRRQQVDPPHNTYAARSFSQGYYIPNDNPWQDVNGGILEEYYTIGLRSPHRAALDTATGYIWIGDVGQGAQEEVSVVTAPGQNMQWPFKEGSIDGDFSPPDPLIGVSTPPIYDYSHSVGNSVIGGFVYHGNFYQGALNGRYIFGDHDVRNIWTYNPDNGEVLFLTNIPDFGFGDKNGISSFALNDEGEVFVLKLYGTDLDGGVIYRLKQDDLVPEPPQLLSQTGAFSDLTTLTPAPGIIPYTVNAPLWSDRADKKRWVMIPNDGTHDTPAEQITFAENSTWQFPPGTVFIKHFDLQIDATTSKRLETRFFVITATGGGYGVTYKWNDAGTDAELLVNSTTKDFNVNLPGEFVGTQTWEFPSRTDCMTCHTANADFILGVQTWQLNGDLQYPSGTTDNQLNTWNHLGMFANPFNPDSIPTFLQSAHINDSSASLETRVRSYLDSNCAHCHRPNSVEGAFDARFSTPLENQNILWTAGVSRNTPSDHYIVKPLDTSESELWIRDGSLGQQAMPPLAKSMVDEDYMAVLTAWINSAYDEACVEVPVSSLQWTDATNGNGPVEIDKSNGEEQDGDGLPMTINGQVFPLGLGVHAHSEITYATNGDYAGFKAYVGIDDEVSGCGSMKFQVWADGVMVAESPLLEDNDPAYLLEADLNFAQEVKLIGTNGDEDFSCDHGDWGNPVFLTCGPCIPGAPCDDGDACTVNDALDGSCNCVGTFTDTDNDTVADVCDTCPGFDDALDNDNDTVPDGCDVCPGFDDTVDTDIDGVPDGCDQCIGFDDNIDLDLDGIPDDCDICLGFDDSLDTDIDGVPDGCDICQEFDDNLDIDLDGVPFGCDVCFGFDDNLDADTDGVPDGCDICPGFNDNADNDLDGVPDGCDICPGFDDNLDSDNDAVPDGCDLCPGYDDAMDNNNNGTPDACEDCSLTQGQSCDDGDACTINDAYDANCNCVGTPDPNDADGDGVPDSCDQCHPHDDNIDTDNDGIPDGCDPCVGLTGLPCDDGNDCTINDVYDANCDCVGTLTTDTDGDGSCDGIDLCQGFDDTLDDDGDGVPDGCDQCPDEDDTIDVDNDNIPDACDSCIGRHGPSCPGGNCTINGNPIISDIYVADQKITSAGWVNPDSSVIFEAGVNVELLPGFKAKPGSYFRAMIVECQNPASRTEVIAESEVLQEGKPDLRVLTNVLSQETVIEYKVAKAGPVSIELTDLRGQVVMRPLAFADREVGTYELRFMSDLPAGIYYALLHYEDGSIQEKMIITGEAVAEEISPVREVPLERKELKVTVRPNPFQNEFKLLIESPHEDMKRAVIRVLDVNGRIIYQKFDAIFNEEMTIIPHSGWVNGVYLIHVRASNYSYTHTLVKQ